MPRVFGFRLHESVLKVPAAEGKEQEKGKENEKEKDKDSKGMDKGGEPSNKLAAPS